MIRGALQAIHQLERIEGRGRNERIKILSDQKNNVHLQTLFRIAYSWLGVGSQVQLMDELPHSKSKSNYEQNFKRFCSLHRDVSVRDLKGMEARQELYNFFSGCDELEQDIYHRTINRDMACGVSSGLLTKIWPDVFKFEYGLPDPKPFNSDRDTLQFPVAVEPIVKGLHCAFVISEGVVNIYSSKFRPYPFLDFLADPFADQIKNGVVEGVITAPLWADVQTLLNSKSKSLTVSDVVELRESIHFHWFDLADPCIFDPDCEYTDLTTFEQRRDMMAKFSSVISAGIFQDQLHIVPVSKAKDLRELRSLKEKFKGQPIVIKPLNAPYENWQSTSRWIWR